MKKLPGSTSALSPLPREWDFVVMLKTSLRKFCFDLQKAEIDTKPLAKLSSTLYGAVMEGRGYLAMLADTLSRRQTPSTKWCREHQLKLVSECFQEMESILSELSKCSPSETENS